MFGLIQLNPVVVVVAVTVAEGDGDGDGVTVTVVVAEGDGEDDGDAVGVVPGVTTLKLSSALRGLWLSEARIVCGPIFQLASTAIAAVKLPSPPT